MIGPLQVRVMRVLWKTGPTTVHQVHSDINTQGHPKLAYTTVLTVLRNLARRNIVTQTKDENERSHIFAAVLTEATFTRLLVKQVAQTYFDGNLDAMAEALTNVIEETPP